MMPLHASAWPRERRDTVFLLLVIAWVVALQAPHLPWWCGALTALVLLWRGQLAWQARPLPATAWRVGLLLLALGATWSTHRTLLGQDAGVTLIVVLLALKTLELRARRDAFVIFFLGFFTLLTQFLFSQTLLTAAGILVALLGLLTALVNAHLPVGRPPLWRSARLAAGMALLGAPIMVLLFVLFPRVAPLWGIPSDGPTGRSGLSGQMQVGQIARLALDDSVAFRVRFDGAVPPARELYFRGPVFSRFDGREWRPMGVGDGAMGWTLPASLVVAGVPQTYEVTQEPSSRPWLFVLEGTAQPPELPGQRPFMTTDLQWRLRQPVTDVIRYRAQSHREYRHGPLRKAVGLQEFVELPPGFNPRTLQLAQDLRTPRQGQIPSPEALIDGVLERLRTGGYRYTLEPGVYGRDSADEFWFDRRLGFCEHIASAFVVLMRAMDIPARVVTGYQGGDRNPVDGYWTVRQSDAHAWAEVWLEGRGWVRVDPTTQVAPARTGALQRLQPAPGLLGQALITISPSTLAQLRAAWEAVNNRWNQWVLNYSQSRQLDLLRALGVRSPQWTDLAYALLAVIVAVSLAGAGWMLWERQRRDPWLALLERARQRLRRQGLDVPAQATPRQLAARLQAQRLGPRPPTGLPGALPVGDGDHAALLACEQWLLDLERQRYDPHSSLTLTALRQRWRVLPWSRIRRGGPGGPAATGPAVPVAPVQVLLATLGLAAGAACLPGDAAAATAKAHGKPAAAEAYARRAEALQWAAEAAARQGLDAAWARRVVGQARRLPEVERLVLPPAVGVAKNWAAYRARFIEPRRIEAGLQFWREHQATLAQAEARYGVPAAIVVGIIGVETFYGRHTGRYRLLDALATLAFDFPAAHPRAAERRAFFRTELEHFLWLIQASGRAADDWLGSYAGAVGLPQFMPSSWRRFAVDFDGDGRIDLMRSPADAIGSVAHYLKAYGWQEGMPTHYAVENGPANWQLDTLLAPDILPTFSATSMQDKGVALGALAAEHRGPLALVELQNGDPAQGGSAPSYVVGTENFYVVTRYNWSSYYAMAVIELGAAVAERAAALKPSPASGSRD